MDVLRLTRKPRLPSRSWHKFANVLFLDTPAFTGFSRSTDNVSGQYWGGWGWEKGTGAGSAVRKAAGL